MTAITTGNPAQKLAAYLPHLPIAPASRKRKIPDTLYLQSTATGLIAYRGNTPVAWIYLGYHRGQIDNQKRTVHFVDVAYHRQTEHGVNLETADFDDLQTALDFVRTTFSNGGAA